MNTELTFSNAASHIIYNPHRLIQSGGIQFQSRDFPLSTGETLHGTLGEITQAPCFISGSPFEGPPFLGEKSWRAFGDPKPQPGR